MLTGENGILTQAQKASEQTDIGKEKEQIALAYNGVKTKNKGGAVTAGELEDELQSNGANATATGDKPITVTFDSGRQYTIDANGNISEPTEANIVVTMKIEGTKIKPTREKIPEGFSPVDVDDAKWENEGEEPTEESINKGLVIVLLILAGVSIAMLSGENRNIRTSK